MLPSWKQTVSSLLETLLKKRPVLYLILFLFVLGAGWTGLRAEPPIILGRTEHCTTCHADTVGLGEYHDPAAIGCASCHGGDREATDAAQAHAGMRLIPGNLATADESCGSVGCHPDASAKVKGNVMNTMAGVVSVTRRFYGEHATQHAAAVTELTHSAPDSHLRGLCASCHLGAEKTAVGPIVETSRGGGCNACHLSYSEADLAAWNDYRARPKQWGELPPKRHPALTSDISDTHCFGCHSRSGRISLSYVGLAELAPDQAAGAEDVLDDGRPLARKPADVHARNMGCTDCHVLDEVMGDGERHAHKAAALRIACTDCHTGEPKSGEFGELNEAEQRAVIVRGGWEPTNRFVLTESGSAILGTLVTDEGVFTRTRRSEAPLVAKAPPPGCSDKAHESVSCEACHSAWAPQCIGCHTEFDPDAEGYDLLSDTPTRGDWIETGSRYRADAPTLGIRTDERGGNEVWPFVPGMILRVDTADHPHGSEDAVSGRLFAPLAPHTIARQGRGCESCHRDPAALGYGRGELRYDADRRSWRFTPAGERDESGLPDDAWIGFLSAPDERPSLHEGARPFGVGEQRRILRVGACLSCHPGDSPVMQAYSDDPAGGRNRLSPQCKVEEVNSTE